MTVVAPTPTTRTSCHARPATRHAAIGVAAWVLVVLVGRARALQLIDQGVHIVLYTPPVLGGYRAAIPWSLWLPVVVGSFTIAVLPRAVERLSWRAVPIVSAVTAGLWWVSLALVDGAAGLTRGLYWDADYASAVPRAAGDPLAFLRHYVASLPAAPIAQRGHPPGFVLLFGALDRLGLHGPAWAAELTLLIGASAVPAVLVTVRVLTNEATARRAAPFVILAPAALWIATSTDAITMATVAWTVALASLAGARPGSRGDMLAIGAGALATASVLQSYGMVLIALPVIVVAIAQRRLRPLLISGSVGAILLASIALSGFWWLGGLTATVHQYRTLDLDRPYASFLLVNAAAWALALGPATFAGLASLRDRQLLLVVGGGLLAAGAAGLSGLSSGEVERIWLSFTIWVLPAGAALSGSRSANRAWLALQVATAITITSFIRTNW